MNKRKDSLHLSRGPCPTMSLKEEESRLFLKLIFNRRTVTDNLCHFLSRESAEGFCGAPPSRASLPPVRVSRSAGLEFPALYRRFPLVACLSYRSVCASTPDTDQSPALQTQRGKETGGRLEESDSRAGGPVGAVVTDPGLGMLVWQPGTSSGPDQLLEVM